MLTVGRVGAGTGCKYLTEQVAAGKDDFAALSPAQALTYYSDVTAHGESPGRWLGRGLSTLGLAGSVRASELENLVGKARHPHYDEQLQRRAVALLNDRSLSVDERRSALTSAEHSLYLGRAFATYESAADRAERAVADLGGDADEASRDAIRARVLAEGDRQAVAAFELTFTPVKSVSVLAAMGGERTWHAVLDAHRAAVDTALEYVQDHAAYSRSGVNGIRQIDTQGLIVAAFEHRMSRDQDPNIHTHAIVANRVQCADGAWRTVDGRAVYAASVGARAVYEQALEVELDRRLGVHFSTEQRRTIREVHGIPLEVIELFSKRRAAIEQAMTGALGQRRDATDAHEHGDSEQVSTGGWRKLARRFALSTRDRKSGAEPTAEAIDRWQEEVREAGYDPQQLMATASRPPLLESGPHTDQQILADARAVLNQTRAVWSRHHAVLAVSRVLPPSGDTFDEHQARVEHLVHQLLAASVQVTPPDVLSVGRTLRRDSDGQSVFTAHADVLFAARSTVDAEQRILACLQDADAPLIPAAQLAVTVARVPLGDDQDAAVHAVLTSGARISAIVGPAGSGKTYVQRAVVAAWKVRTADDICGDHAVAPGGGAESSAVTAPADVFGHREVLALAPSQVAASVLAESIGTRAENIPRWLAEHRRQTKLAAAAPARGVPYVPDPAWTLQPGQLVIVDEAGMVTTRELDAVLTVVRKAGAKLLLVGDDRQLGAIGAGGMFRTMVDRTNAPVLSTVRRFHDEHGNLRNWECVASLGLRNRDLDAIAEYERRGRIHAGPPDRMQETSYRAWLRDHLSFQHTAAAGDAASGHARSAAQVRVALLMADTEDAAAALSARARADLVHRGLVEQRGVGLADGNLAGVGDLVVTRLNERRLRADAGEGFVANRDTWRVVDRSRDGSLTVVSVTSIATGNSPGGEPRTLTLPASYVAANVQLAYAGTVHSAQGRTVTTARGLVTEATSAEALYVMMSRGWLSNEAYVVTGDSIGNPGREAHQRWPAQHHLSVLAAILERDDRPSASVTDVQRDLYDQTTSIARLRVMFADLSTVVRGATYQQIIADLAGAEIAQRAVTDPAWAGLVRALGHAQLVGWDSRHLLIQALTQRGLGDADDVAAVLHWRSENITGHWQKPTECLDPAADAVTHALALTWRDRATGILDAARGDSLSDPVSADAADALVQVAAVMDLRVEALAERLAEQASIGQQGGYEDGRVPGWLRALGPVPTTARDLSARRADWLTQARAVALYQDAVDYQPANDATQAETHASAVDRANGLVERPREDLDPIGPRPPAGDAEARELWNAARRALAEAPLAGTMRAMLPARLKRWVAEGAQCETHTQPAYVGHELRTLNLRARSQRSRVHRLRHEVTTATAQLNAANRRRWRRSSDPVESLTRTHDGAANALARAEATLQQIERDLRAVTGMHESWQEWERASRDVRVRARLATQELGLRGITPPDIVATATRSTPSVSQPSAPHALDRSMGTPPAAAVSSQVLAQQYVILDAAARWFRSRVDQRWASDYLQARGLSEPAAAANVGYAPSGPGRWTLLIDHLRGLGFHDAAIEMAGLAARSRHNELIDRFRDRVMLPVLDTASRPIGFVGRKPAGDTNPDNPKYLNPTSTPLYDKSRVLYGMDANSIVKLQHGARAIIVEGPMDRLAIELAAPGLVPLATCGTSLTDAHLDLLAAHTSLGRIILAFDSDAAGRKATLAAGRKLAARAVPTSGIELFTAPQGSDPAEILATSGPERLAVALTDPQQRRTLLDLLVEELLDRYDWAASTTSLRDLPIASHAAYDVTRFVAETVRDRIDTGDVDLETVQRQLTRIGDRTGISQRELNAYLVTVAFPDDQLDALEPRPDEMEDDHALSSSLNVDALVETDHGRDAF